MSLAISVWCTRGLLHRICRCLAAVIQGKLKENVRCFCLNSPSMIVGLQTYLFAGGTDVTQEIINGRLVLRSDATHLVKGHFNIDRMLHMLQTALEQALREGCQGLWVSGDMTREFGQQRDFSQLLEYEWRLEEFLRAHPALSGVCQYHADSLPPKVLQQGLLTHPGIFINETLSRINAHYTEPASFTPSAYNHKALDATIRALCNGSTPP